jgi:hypothetical protein
MILKQENGILIQLSLGHAHITQTTTKKMKTPDDECGWYSGKQMFMLLQMGDMAQVKNNQLGAFLRSLKIKRQ